jgi:cell division protein FtsQ
MAAVSKSGRARTAVLPARRVRRTRALLLARGLPSGRALLLGFSLLGGGALAYVGARESSLFALRSVHVTGAPPRVAAHVRAALTPLRGRSLLAVNRGQVERRLAGLPDVAAVSFDRSFPHTLRVFVTPAHSIALVRRGASAWIVSSDGRVVRAADLFAAPRLPRIWIPKTVAVDVGMTLADTDATLAVRALAIARRSGFGKRIAAVRSAGRDLTFVLATGPELRLADATSLPLKLAVATHLLARVSGTSGYIDLALPGRPVIGGNAQVAG